MIPNSTQPLLLDDNDDDGWITVSDRTQTCKDATNRQITDLTRYREVIPLKEARWV